MYTNRKALLNLIAVQSPQKARALGNHYTVPRMHYAHERTHFRLGFSFLKVC